MVPLFDQSLVFFSILYQIRSFFNSLHQNISHCKICTLFRFLRLLPKVHNFVIINKMYTVESDFPKSNFIVKLLIFGEFKTILSQHGRTEHWKSLITKSTQKLDQLVCKSPLKLEVSVLRGNLMWKLFTRTEESVRLKWRCPSYSYASDRGFSLRKTHTFCQDLWKCPS